MPSMSLFQSKHGVKRWETFSTEKKSLIKAPVFKTEKFSVSSVGRSTYKYLKNVQTLDFTCHFQNRVPGDI